MEGETIRFEVEETRKDLSIIICDDEALEELEYFNVSIRAVPGVFPVVVKNSQAIVEIVDNDREHTHTHTHTYAHKVMISVFLCAVAVIGFSPVTYSTKEDQNALSISVLLMYGTLQRSVQVQLSTNQDSATGWCRLCVAFQDD